MLFYEGLEPPFQGWLRGAHLVLKHNLVYLFAASVLSVITIIIFPVFSGAIRNSCHPGAVSEWVRGVAGRRNYILFFTFDLERNCEASVPAAHEATLEKRPPTLFCVSCSCHLNYNNTSRKKASLITAFVVQFVYEPRNERVIYWRILENMKVNGEEKTKEGFQYFPFFFSVL